MREIQHRFAKQTCYCRGCDKEIKPDTEKIITFYSFRNRGQHIHLCEPCVREFYKLVSADEYLAQ